MNKRDQIETIKDAIYSIKLWYCGIKRFKSVRGLKQSLEVVIGRHPGVNSIQYKCGGDFEKVLFWFINGGLKSFEIYYSINDHKTQSGFSLREIEDGSGIYNLKGW